MLADILPGATLHVVAFRYNSLSHIAVNYITNETATVEYDSMFD